MMTGYNVHQEAGRSAWPPHFNKVIAEVQQKNIEAVGMPKWDAADQTLAKALQKEMGKPEDGLKDKVEEFEAAFPETEQGGFGRRWRHFVGGADGVSEVSGKHSAYSWPQLGRWGGDGDSACAQRFGGRSEGSGPHRARFDALRGHSAEGLDLLQRHSNERPESYTPLIAPEDQPAIEMNREKNGEVPS